MLLAISLKRSFIAVYATADHRPLLPFGGSFLNRFERLLRKTFKMSIIAQNGPCGDGEIR
jgi:hypothetical protein